MSKKDFMLYIPVYDRTTDSQKEIEFGDALETRLDIQTNGFSAGYDSGVEYLAPALKSLYEAVAWLHSHTGYFGEEGDPAIPSFMKGWGWLNPNYLAEDEIDGLIYGFEGSVHVIITLVKRPKISF